jgi:GT2 family glycosyltransferase
MAGLQEIASGQMTPSNEPGRPVCVVVVNWNGWRDTLMCLASLFALEGHPLHIVVCDNGSTDESREMLSTWLGEQLVSAHPDAARDAQVLPFSPPVSAKPGWVRDVHLLCLARNLGYAGGLNRGIDWGRTAFGVASFWLLNNDIRAEPAALRSLIEARDEVPDAGLCGSVLLDWDQPTDIQAIGGIFNKALGVGWHLRELPRRQEAGENVFLSVDYPVGASLLVEQDYIDKVGLMDESYFLYYEEMDWAERGRRHGYRTVIALKSRLLHKEGASTGSHGGVRNLSTLSEHYSVVNRLRITRKLWPRYLPLVWLSLGAVALERLVHGNRARAILVLRLMLSPWLWLTAPRAPRR